MESNYAQSRWYWEAFSEDVDDNGHGETETRHGAIRAAKRFCKNPNPPEKPDRYDFSFQVRTGKR